MRIFCGCSDMDLCAGIQVLNTKEVPWDTLRGLIEDFGKGIRLTVVR